MLNKIKIDEIIVVEGKDDITNLSRILDATFFKLDGYNGLNNKKISILKELSKKNKLILLTDPDFMGKKIREKINKNIPNNIVNLYVKRDISTSLNGNIGVENISEWYIKELFIDYLKNQKEDIKEIKTNKYKYTIENLMKDNLVGGKNSKLRREILGDILKIGYYNSKSLLNILNTMNLSYEKYNEAINSLNNIMKEKNRIGIIFGKFIPLHKGHINFIKDALEYVDKLYVTLCLEKIRDNNLIINSTLPKYINEVERFNLIKDELSNLINVEILILREEGINSYPNGWEDWSKKVTKLLHEKNITINYVFTNEIQDVLNYKRYFSNNKVFSKNLEVIMIDPNRIEFNVSATKIRNNYNEFKKYLPEKVYNFFEK